MQLMRDEAALEHQHADVVFLVKPKATAYDRLQVVMAQQPTEFMERAIRQMVVGWKGVTDGEGKAVPYNFDALKLLPDPDPKKGILLTLGTFILEHTDVAKAAQEKNV